ncbi:MAG: 2-succinyl-5-enolpyruvyl-6-hydroxy-3-cyclohexene-1-carboxylic-acid synthase [Acidimicrobiales bacterium]
MSAQATFAATLVDEWVRAGLTDAVVAPGSRSTPLVAALAADGRLRLHVVLDERSAGFLALGLGLATGRPAPVVVTSGTAAVELHPAVVEAHQAGVPMVAVTADRPPELHAVGAPQTVVQAGLYGGSVRFAADPGVPSEAMAGAWRSLAARVVAEAVGHPAGPGPVHLNLRFRDPLLGEPSELPPARPGGRPWHALAGGRAPAPAPGLVAELAAAAGGAGLVVAGGGAGGAAVELAEALGWPLLADPRSGAHLAHPLAVAAADSLLRVPEVAAWRPTHVLRVGRPWASKVLGGWLAGLDSAQLLVDPTGAWADPERSAGVVAAAAPALLAAAVGAAVGSPRPPSDWAQRWVAAEAAAQAAIDACLAAEAGPTEPGVARAVAAAVPAGGALVTASSMPVRDVEWWGRPRSGVAVFANRGANGIDGVCSTAIGVALGAGAPTVALLGDLAFVHDAGALLWAAGRPAELTVVVVDNDGGGIFSFLPQAAALPRERFERLWGTPHGIDLVAVARAYGVAAESVGDLDALRARVGDPRPGVSVVVVGVPDRRENVAVHERLERAVADAVAATAGPPPPAAPAA